MWQYERSKTIGICVPDPYNQASLTYRKYWADNSRELGDCEHHPSDCGSMVVCPRWRLPLKGGRTTFNGLCLGLVATFSVLTAWSLHRIKIRHFHPPDVLLVSDFSNAVVQNEMPNVHPRCVKVHVPFSGIAGQTTIMYNLTTVSSL